MPKSATKWRLLQSAALIKTCPASPILGRFHFSAVTPTLLPKSSLPLPVFGCTRDSGVRRAFISWGSGGRELRRKPAVSPRLLEATSQPRTAHSCARSGSPGARPPRFALPWDPLRRRLCSQGVVLCRDLEVPAAQPAPRGHCHPARFPPQGIRA